MDLNLTNGFLGNFVSEIAIVLILGIGRLLGFDFYYRVLKIYRYIYFNIVAMFGYKYVIVYTDCDVNGYTTNRIARLLKSHVDAKNIYIPINSPTKLNLYPIQPRLCNAVLLIITDVTQLSTSERIRHKIQNDIEKFVVNGGVLILGHDAVYRRTKNEILQHLAGCELLEYSRLTDDQLEYVRYDKISDNEEYRVLRDDDFLKDLPEKFALFDNEIVAGKWTKDVKYLYALHDEKEGRNIPLVTRRQRDKGCVFWLNSGDKAGEGEPVSVTEMDENLLSVICKFVEHDPTNK